MKKSLLLLIFPLLVITGCLKTKTPACDPTPLTIKAPDSEIAALKGTLIGMGILATLTEDSRGFLYVFTTTGTGTKPNVCSVVKVDYEAHLMNGTKVDAGTDISYPVNAFIVGWQEMLPLMPVGSTVTLYVPPFLGYGNIAAGPIPANSNLRFDITLKAVQ